jgi:hypothetical protein
MFEVKARSIPYNGAPERYFTLVRFSLTCKHLARLEMLARDILAYYEH